MSLSNLEKKLLEGANPDLIELIQSKYIASVSSVESMIDLLNQEHFDAAKQISARATNSMASFLGSLADMQHFAATGEDPTVNPNQTQLEMEPAIPKMGEPIQVAQNEVAPEPVPVHEEPAPEATPEVEPITDQPQGEGQLV